MYQVGCSLGKTLPDVIDCNHMKKKKPVRRFGPSDFPASRRRQSVLLAPPSISGSTCPSPSLLPSTNTSQIRLLFHLLPRVRLFPSFLFPTLLLPPSPSRFGLTPPLVQTTAGPFDPYTKKPISTNYDTISFTPTSNPLPSAPVEGWEDTLPYSASNMPPLPPLSMRSPEEEEAWREEQRLLRGQLLSSRT
jgi:hypothetical protein